MPVDTIVSNPGRMDARGVLNVLRRLKRYQEEFAPDSADVGVAGIYNATLGSQYIIMSKDEADEKKRNPPAVDRVMLFYPTSYFEERLADFEKSKGKYANK